MPIPDTLSKAHGSLKNIDVVITGHSSTMTMNDLREYAEFIRDFLNPVRAGKKSGKTADENRNRLYDSGKIRRLCVRAARST